MKKKNKYWLGVIYSSDESQIISISDMASSERNASYKHGWLDSTVCSIIMIIIN